MNYVLEWPDTSLSTYLFILETLGFLVFHCLWISFRRDTFYLLNLWMPKWMACKSLGLLQRTLPVHSGRMILYFNVRGAVFLFVFFSPQFPFTLEEEESFTATLTPCPLCYGHNKELRLMDTLCCHQSLFHECPARLSPVMTQEKVMLSANCSYLSLHLQGKL